MIALIETERTIHGVPIAVSCRALGLSESSFYKHHGRPPTKARERRGQLDLAIAGVFTGVCTRHLITQSMSRSGSCLDCDDCQATRVT